MNEGLRTHVSIDDRKLFVCEVIDKNLEEDYMEEISGSVDMCREPDSHDECACSDVDNRKLDPARVGEAR